MEPGEVQRRLQDVIDYRNNLIEANLQYIEEDIEQMANHSKKSTQIRLSSAALHSRMRIYMDNVTYHSRTAINEYNQERFALEHLNGRND